MLTSESIISRSLILMMSQTNASLETLPAEIFNTIIDDASQVVTTLMIFANCQLKITRSSDLNSLCQVSQGLHSLLTPRLWSTICIGSRRENDSSPLDILGRHQTATPSKDYLQFVKHLDISAWLYASYQYPGCSGLGCGFSVQQQLPRILNSLKSHQLLSFR